MDLSSIINLAKNKYFDAQWYLKKYKKLPYIPLMKYFAAYKYLKSGVKKGHSINQYFNIDEFNLMNKTQNVISALLLDDICPLYEEMYCKINVKNFYETVYEHIQEKYSKKIKELKNKNAINVLFIVNMASVFPAENLMNKLKDDEKYNVSICVAPRINQDIKSMELEYAKTLKELERKYGNIVKGAVKIEKETIVGIIDYIEESDIICYPTPYDYNLLYYRPIYAFYKGKLTIHINYGFFRGIYDRIIYQLDNYNKFWKVFLETEISQNEYKEYGLYNGENSIVTGYSKMDRLKSNQVKNEKKIIIIAPHHTIDEYAHKEIKLSNFEKYEKFFLELPAKYPNIHFHFRPHPLLFPNLRKSRGNKYIEEYIHKLKKYTNITLDEKGDYFEIFAKADGIIQDCGSFLVEWFYTNKPGCYMLADISSKDKYFNELGKQCLDNTYIAYREDDIYNYIDEVIIKGNDYMKNKRDNFAKLIKNNYPYATDNIVKYLDKELERG